MARYRVQTQIVHSTLPDEDIDWYFSVHPDKEIKSIHKLKDDD